LVDCDRAKSGGVTLGSREGGHLGQQTLNQVANGHAGRDGVGVDNQVRRQSLTREGHVLLPVRHTAGTLLSVAGGKFVSNLGDSHSADADLDELVAFRKGGRDHDLVDNALLISTQGNGGITLSESPGLLVDGHVVIFRGEGDSLANNDVIAEDLLSRSDQAVILNLVIVPSALLAVSPGLFHGLEWAVVVFLLSLLLLVGAVVHGPKEPAIDGGLVNDDTILLIVSRVRCDGDNG